MVKNREKQENEEVGDVSGFFFRIIVLSLGGQFDMIIAYGRILPTICKG